MADDKSINEAYNRAKEISQLYSAAVKGTWDGGANKPDVSNQIAMQVAFDVYDEQHEQEDE